MTWASDFVNYSVPWWVWLIPSSALVVAVTLVVMNSLGFRRAIYAAAATAVAALLVVARQRGRQEGRRESEEKVKRDAEAIRKRAVDARARSVAESNDKRLRDDDGFRRD